MKFFITGAAGFIGSALTNRLIANGHHVIGLDDFSAGSAEHVSPLADLIQGNINDRKLLWKLLQNVDCVYHLAAKVIVPNSMRYPHEFESVNVGGTVTLLEAMFDRNNRRLIFSSSGAVYGNQNRLPLKETLKPMPASPYAVSKLAAEYYINTLGKQWGLEALCLRIFNAYGPNQGFSFTHAPVIPNFLRQSATVGTVVVHGSGEKTRDFIFIDDVVDALIAASTVSNPNELCINIGSGCETSVNHVLELASKITQKMPEVINYKNRAFGPDRMCADIHLAQKKLKFKPKIDLETGMRITFNQDNRLSQ